MGHPLTDVYTHAELIELAEQHGIARVNGKSADELAKDLTDSGYVYSERADRRRNPSYPRRYQGVDMTEGPVRIGNAVLTPLTAAGLPDPEREVTDATIDEDGNVDAEGGDVLEEVVIEKKVRPPDPNIAPEVKTADELNPAIQTEPTKRKSAEAATEAKSK